MLAQDDRKIDAIVHSIAFADFAGHADKLSQASKQAFLQSQHISAYSFLETVQCAIANNRLIPYNASLTALSYLGAVRAVPNYHLMGLAKASLEAVMRGLASELGPLPHHVRVNAVSAGPVHTAAARGISDFRTLFQHCHEHSPTGNPTVHEIAETVTWVADAAAAGITGQTIYVDGGYSNIVPVR